MRQRVQSLSTSRNTSNPNLHPLRMLLQKETDAARYSEQCREKSVRFALDYLHKPNPTGWDLYPKAGGAESEHKGEFHQAANNLVNRQKDFVIQHFRQSTCEALGSLQIDLTCMPPAPRCTSMRQEHPGATAVWQTWLASFTLTCACWTLVDRPAVMLACGALWRRVAKATWHAVARQQQQHSSKA